MNTKKYLYDKLVAWLWSSIPVFFQSDNENENRFWDKFPLVTFYRITANHYRTTQRDELFQITAWALTWLEAEQVKDTIIDSLNTNDEKIVKIKISIGWDILDPSVKAHGIPITFWFTIKD